MVNTLCFSFDALKAHCFIPFVGKMLSQLILHSLQSHLYSDIHSKVLAYLRIEYVDEMAAMQKVRQV